MQLSAIVLTSAVVACITLQVECRGAGRAFPIESENYAISQFSNINSRLEWDPTNFLVDLAGYHANCDSAGVSLKTFAVDKNTPEGESISGIVDSVEGSRADADAVNEYIKTIIDEWVRRGSVNSLVRGADKFGCSVRPGCRGTRSSAVVACLFSPGSGLDNGWQGDQPPENIVEVRALAFTPEQYKIAEQYTGKEWDRSHLLENLSGMETKCDMIGNDDWSFNELLRVSEQYSLRINPLYGWAPNLGTTQAALDEILINFKKIGDKCSSSSLVSISSSNQLASDQKTSVFSKEAITNIPDYM